MNTVRIVCQVCVEYGRGRHEMRAHGEIPKTDANKFAWTPGTYKFSCSACGCDRVITTAELERLACLDTPLVSPGRSPYDGSNPGSPGRPRSIGTGFGPGTATFRGRGSS